MKPLCIDLFCGLGGLMSCGNPVEESVEKPHQRCAKPLFKECLWISTENRFKLSAMDVDSKNSEPGNSDKIPRPQQQSEHWGCSVCLKPLS